MRAAGGRRGESGFTLIELMFAMVLFGTLVTIAIPPYKNYRTIQQHKGATREMVAFLRRAQVRAVAEETTYRVDIASDGQSARTYRFNGTTYTAGQILRSPSAKIRFTSATFAAGPVTGTGVASVFFYARGSASKGTLSVTRKGSSAKFTIDVEGLTARVSYK